MSGLPVRWPAVAGQFYPDDPGRLRSMIQGYLDAASVPADLGPVRAALVPHAGYIYSGPIAAVAFKALGALLRQKWTVFLMGPSHRAYFSGVSLGGFSAFRTPLGDAPVANDRVEELLTRSPHYIRAPEAHRVEHCLEVEVPFLQMQLPDFQLVPMLFGDADARAVGLDLAEHLREGDLVIVSSDLSHYLPYEHARRLDRALLEALVSGDEAAVAHGEACGRAPAVACMEVARSKGWKPVLLDYRNSGDTAGDRQQVVGYGAVAYTA